jgi:hypothetical protein
VKDAKQEYRQAIQHHHPSFQHLNVPLNNENAQNASYKDENTQTQKINTNMKMWSIEPAIVFAPFLFFLASNVTHPLCPRLFAFK